MLIDIWKALVNVMQLRGQWQLTSLQTLGEKNDQHHTDVSLYSIINTSSTLLVPSTGLSFEIHVSFVQTYRA